MARRQLAFLTVLLVGGSVLFYATLGVRPFHGKPLDFGGLSFGSRETGNTAWLIPRDTLISTSYVANQSFSGFIESRLLVFPYQIQPGTILYLSLYLNGQLVGTQKYDVSIYGGSASILGTVKQGVAKFSNDRISFTASQSPLTTTFRAGTIMTLMVWVSNPIWVQIDSASSTNSYETFGPTSYSPSTTILSEAGTICPLTLSVGLETNAG